MPRIWPKTELRAGSSSSRVKTALQRDHTWSEWEKVSSYSDWSPELCAPSLQLDLSGSGGPVLLQVVDGENRASTLLLVPISSPPGMSEKCQISI